MRPVSFPWRMNQKRNSGSSASPTQLQSEPSQSRRSRDRKGTLTSSSDHSPPRIIEITSDRSSNMSSSDGPVVPEHILPILYSPPQFPTEIDTATSAIQDSTHAACHSLYEHSPFPLVSSEKDGEATKLPILSREKHVEYLKKLLGNDSKLSFMVDPSKPWMVYWCITALAALGENVETDEYRKGVIQALTPCQNPEGGFGGGHGHISHCAPSYAAVLSLCTVGGDEALSVVNRQRMWEWLGRMKQADGGFIMNEGGELDVRGAFCTIILLSILDLPIELPPNAPARKAGLTTFTCRLGEWVSKCQTYEGGLGSCPGNEAHGAFAYCAVNTLALIGPPQITVPKYLDLPGLLRWMSYRQTCEGGFAGRSNKLVDGCYSHWVGNTWSILDAALGGVATERGNPDLATNGGYAVQKSDESFGDWANRNGAYVGKDSPELWPRAELIQYTLYCCQDSNGGIADKPGVNPDAYHTLYNIAGLSAAQNRFYVPFKKDDLDPNNYKDRIMGPHDWRFIPIMNPGTSSLNTAEFRPEKRSLSDDSKQDNSTDDSQQGYTQEQYSTRIISHDVDKQDRYSTRVRVLHPVYVVPWGVPERSFDWYNKREWRE